MEDQQTSASEAIFQTNTMEDLFQQTTSAIEAIFQALPEMSIEARTRFIERLRDYSHDNHRCGSDGPGPNELKSNLAWKIAQLITEDAQDKLAWDQFRKVEQILDGRHQSKEDGHAD
jgi:hypothetical protein